MKPCLSLAGSIVILSFISITFFCVDLPENPALDPTKADVVLFTENGNIGSGVVHLHAGDSSKIMLRIVYTKQFQTVHVTTSCNVFKKDIVPDTSESFDTTYFTPVFTTTGACTVFVTGVYVQDDFKDKVDTLAFYIFPGEPDINFVTIPPSLTTQTVITDTLLFVTETKGDAGTPEYAVTVTPALDDEQLYKIYSAKKDTLRIIFKPAVADTFTVTVIATATNGEKEVKDTALTEIQVHADTEPPVITSQLASKVQVIEGETLTLKIEATGIPAPKFQWYKDDMALQGQTAAGFSKTEVTASDSGVYHVVVSNGIDTCVTSEKATVTVRLKAVVTEDPKTVLVNQGGDAAFTVEASGEAPLSYQWLEDGEVITGETAATYRIRDVATADSGKKFSCVVGNMINNDTSAAAILTVTSTPVYKVTFDVEGGEPAVTEQMVKSGEKATIPDSNPAKDGFKFDGWFTSKTCEVEYDFSAAITGDQTIYAKWSRIPARTVTYHGNGNTGGTVPPTTNHLSGMQINVASCGTLERTGSTFLGWNTDSAGNGIDYAAGAPLVTGNENVDLYARWIINKYKVTFDSREGSEVPVQTIDHGNTIPTPAVPTKPSYTFAGWYKDTVYQNEWDITTDNVTAVMTLYAKWVVMDADGNEYTTVTIGTQTWLVENLKTTKYNDGSDIPLVVNDKAWSELSTSGYCWYANDREANKDKYGALYNWYAVNTGKLAPKGWHVPSDSEWHTFNNFLIANGYNWDGTTEDDKVAKSLAAKTDWKTSTKDGAIGNDLTKNNKSGFSALPSGIRNSDDGSYGGLGSNFWWWLDMGGAEEVSDEVDFLPWGSSSLDFDCVYMCNAYISAKKAGASVRCIRN